jgi:hypothetical protein
MKDVTPPATEEARCASCKKATPPAELARCAVCKRPTCPACLAVYGHHMLACEDCRLAPW